MAGRFIDLKNTAPLADMKENMYAFRRSRYYRIQLVDEVTLGDIHLERYKDDPTGPDRCQDEPCRFNSYPNRLYFFRTRSDYSLGVFSAYRALTDIVDFAHLAYNPIDCAILLIADGCFAGGIYKDGELIQIEEIETRRNPKTSKSDKLAFQEKVESVISKWKDHLEASKVVLVRCTYNDKLTFFDGKTEISDCKYKHIPFETGRPTKKEVERVHDRVMRCVDHGDLETAVRKLKEQRRRPDGATERTTLLETTNTSSRRLEKKNWPWIDAKLAKRLIEHVENDNGDGLLDEVERHSHKKELIEYLNSAQERFNYGTFLHFAVQCESTTVIQCLLELGCDPSLPDEKGKVSFEICRLDEIREVFVTFRVENTDRFNWNKSKIPEKHEMPLHNERKKDQKEEKREDASRKKRREKLDNRRMRNILVD